MTFMKENVLVIGSKNHVGAQKCIEWGEELVYVGDYDALVVNTTTLTEEKLHEILSRENTYFASLRKDIEDVQKNRGIKIVCIISPYIFIFGDTFRQGSSLMELLKSTPNNYSWSPIIPYFENIPNGAKLVAVKSTLFKDYIEKIKKYNLVYQNSINNTKYIDSTPDREIFTKLYNNTLLNNPAGRNVAFSIQWKVHRYTEYNVIVNSNLPIHFLPPTEDLGEDISLIIGELTKMEEDLPPEWLNEFSLPGEQDMQNGIVEKFKQIEFVNKEIQGLQIELNFIKDYKKLLYAQGKELESIVEKSFGLLEIKLESPSITTEEDRFFKTADDKKIYIEIRGVNRLMNEGDLAQIIKRIAEKPSSTEYTTRGVFVFNRQNKINISERNNAFHHNIQEQAKSFNVCLIDTEMLYKLVERKLDGESIPDLDKIIFNTVGVFKL